jgi:hypothetical protein
MAEPVDAAGKLAVGHLLVAAVDGHLVLASGLQVLVDDNARVVPLGHRDHGPHSSLGKAFDCDRLRLRIAIERLYPVLA